MRFSHDKTRQNLLVAPDSRTEVTALVTLEFRALIDERWPAYNRTQTLLHLINKQLALGHFDPLVPTCPISPQLAHVLALHTIRSNVDVQMNFKMRATMKLMLLNIADQYKLTLGGVIRAAYINELIRLEQEEYHRHGA